MRVTHLWLTDFRNYPSAELVPSPGLTAIMGANGEGKTNLLEAVGYLATTPRDPTSTASCASARPC